MHIEDPAGVRQLTAEDLPLRLGTGPEADLRVPGPLSARVHALIGVLDGRPFLQLADPDSGLTVNGAAPDATRWLADGDEIAVGGARIRCAIGPGELRFVQRYVAGDADTLPPAPPAARAIDAGVAVTASPLPKPAVVAPASSPRRWPWLVYGALGVLALLAFQLFTARAVLVEVQPATARLTLSGALLPIKIGGRYLLRPGSYQVTAEADGFETGSREIIVDGEPNQVFRLELAKLPDRVVILTDPAMPVRVFVDGVELASPGTEGLMLAEGSHTLKIEAARYLPFEQVLQVSGGGQVQTFEARLAPAWADVFVTSVPAGATVLAGGEPVGETPARIELLAGRHELSLEKDGYKVWREEITVTPGEVQRLPEIVLAEADGILRIVTTPVGAAVSVNGRYRGTTPAEVELTPGKAAKVTLSKPGYATVSRSVTLPGRRGETLRVVLEARVGVVTVRATPPDAALFVDGEPAGPAAQELTLPAVPHRLEIRKAGYEDYQVEVTPKPGLPQLIEVRLLTPQEAVIAATPQTVKTSQGGVLRLVQPGDFEMGAPRREQGRRPNESQRKVRLTRPFYIGLREVTNSEYREFQPNHTSGAEKYRELAGGDHPAVMLSWEDAVGYCNWLSDRDGLAPAYATVNGRLVLVSPPTTGYRLPTEAEWAWAARYNGGGGPRRFPWGQEMPPAPKSGNFADRSARSILANVLVTYEDGYPVTAPTGRFPPSPLGLYDLGGNAAEWVSDLYTVYSTPSPEVAVDPTGPLEGQYHVIRGSGWRHASISELRFSYRDFGDSGRLDVGFRLARYAEAGQD